MERTHIVGGPVDRREVDVELLDDTRIERVVVHDEDVAVPQALLRLEDQTTLVLLAFDLDLRLLLAIVVPSLLLFLLLRLVDLRLLLARRDLVGHDVARLVEAVQQNVLVPLGTVSGERAVPADGSLATSSRQRHGSDAPGVSGQVGQLASERKRLDFRSDSHLEVRIGLALQNEMLEVGRGRVDVVEELGRVFRVDVFAGDSEVRLTHLGQRPCRRVNERL